MGADSRLELALGETGAGSLGLDQLPDLLRQGIGVRVDGPAVQEGGQLAYEAAARLTKVIDAKRAEHQGPTYRGWWHVGLIGPVAAALAACRLKGADVEQAARAIGIATASSAGFRRSMGTMTKALHSGNAARAGIEAALLSMRGFTGDPEIIEAPLGFVAAIAMPNESDATPITERLGSLPARIANGFFVVDDQHIERRCWRGSSKRFGSHQVLGCVIARDHVKFFCMHCRVLPSFPKGESFKRPGRAIRAPNEAASPA